MNQLSKILTPKESQDLWTTDVERFTKEHPWLMRWAHFKFHITEWLAKYLNIHWDW